MKYTLCLCISALLFTIGISGCTDDTKSQSQAAVNEPAAAAVTQQDLLHRRFVLKSANGKDYSQKNRVPDLSFNEGMRISGGICNHFVGQAALDQNTLTAPNMASTKMLCADQELNELESAFAEMLRAGAAVVLNDEGLILRGDKLEMVFTRADWVQ